MIDTDTKVYKKEYNAVHCLPLPFSQSFSFVINTYDISGRILYMNGYTATAMTGGVLMVEVYKKSIQTKYTTPLIVCLSETAVHFPSSNIVIDYVKPNGGRKVARV